MKILFVMILMLLSARVQAQEAYSHEAVRLLIEKGELLQAEQAINRATSVQRSDAEWNYNKGLLAFVRRQYPEAVSEFEHSVEAEPLNIKYRLALGNASCSEAREANIFRSPGLARQCKASFEKVLEMDSLHVGAMQNLILFHLEAPGIVGGSRSEAERLSDVIMDLDIYRGYMSRFSIAMSDQDSTAMLQILNDGSEALPDSAYFPMNRSLILGEMKRYDEAHEEIARALQLQPDSPMLHFYNGRLSGLSGKNLDSGMQSLDRMLTDFEGMYSELYHSMAYVMMGRIHLKKENTDAARIAFEKALEIMYDNPVAGEELKKLNNR